MYVTVSTPPQQLFTYYRYVLDYPIFVKRCTPSPTRRSANDCIFGSTWHKITTENRGAIDNGAGKEEVGVTLLFRIQILDNLVKRHSTGTHTHTAESREESVHRYRETNQNQVLESCDVVTLENFIVMEGQCTN